MNDAEIPMPEAVDPAADLNELQSKSGKRLNNKVTRLPRAVREKLNELLAEGLPYSEILQQLGEEGGDLNDMDISRWMHSGHNKWLKQRRWLDHVTDTFEVAKDMVSENKAMSIHEANLHIAATQMYEAILGCDPATLPKVLETVPNSIFSLLAAVPRFSHQALNFQKFRESCAAARAELQKLRDPKRQLTHEERRAIVDKVDDILGLK